MKKETWFIIAVIALFYYLYKNNSTSSNASTTTTPSTGVTVVVTGSINSNGYSTDINNQATTTSSVNSTTVLEIPTQTEIDYYKSMGLNIVSGYELESTFTGEKTSFARYTFGKLSDGTWILLV